MAEKQPTSYVVCRYSTSYDKDGLLVVGDNIPVKVFDTRKAARDYSGRLNKRSKRYGYTYYPVKQG